MKNDAQHPHFVLKESGVLISTNKVNVVARERLWSHCVFQMAGGGGGGTTRPLPRDGGAEELRGDPTVGPHPKVWTIDRE